MSQTILGKKKKTATVTIVRIKISLLESGVLNSTGRTSYVCFLIPVPFGHQKQTHF